MKTVIKFNGKSENIDIDNEESIFYKTIGEKLIEISKISLPVNVTIEANNGIAEFSLGLRSGTLFIKETFNNIKLNSSTSTYKKCYLVCVNAQKNNYKFYQLEDVGDEIIATYGRMGAKKGELYGERSYRYQKNMYWIKYFEKISKGYIDKSDIYLSDSKTTSKTISPSLTTATKENASEYLFAKLYSFAKKTVETTCVSSNVTKKMVTESNKILKKMYNRKTVKGFNKQLLELLEIAPRKVSQVASLLAKDISDFPKIIYREENLISAMEVLVPKKKTSKEGAFAKYNTEVYIATDKQKEQVLSHLDDSLKPHVKNIFRVINNTQQKKFNKYLNDNNISTVKQLWHGSRNENWASIIINGLQLHPNAVITGKMFGDGIYFAPSSKKSWGYTSYKNTYWANGNSDSAFMGLYATAYGNPLDVSCAYRYSQTILNQHKANCVHAHAGTQLRNDEIIFYSESALTLNYIVEFD